MNICTDIDAIAFSKRDDIIQKVFVNGVVVVKHVGLHKLVDDHVKTILFLITLKHLVKLIDI